EQMIDGVRVEYEQRGVAVPRRLCGLRLSDRAAGARLVLDDDGTAEPLAELRADDARDAVHGPARRPGNDHADRLVWVAFSKRGCREQDCREPRDDSIRILRSHLGMLAWRRSSLSRN